MRILMVSWEYPPVMVGGLGRHVYCLTTELARRGNDVVVVTRAPESSHRDHPATTTFTTAVTTPSGGRIRVLSTALIPVAIDFTDNLVAWTILMGQAMTMAIGDLLAGEGVCAESGSWIPDIVHGHDWLVALPSVAAAQKAQVPLVGTFHATEAGRNSGWLSQLMHRHIHSLEWWYAHLCDHLITCSPSMKKEVTDAYGDATSGSPGLPPITVLPNGIDPEHWHCTRPAARTTTAPHLLYFGRLEWEKGVHDILSCLPLLRREFPGIHATIVGDGMKKEWLHDECRRHRLDGCVTFTGPLDHRSIQDLLSTADLVVIPSRYEPFGIVAVEAAAAGAPLVAAQTGGLTSLITDGETGWTYPAGVIEEMVATIRDALCSPEERDKRAAALHSMVCDDSEESPSPFRWSSIAHHTADIYAELHQSHQHPTAELRNSLALPRPLIPTRLLPERDPFTPISAETLRPW